MFKQIALFLGIGLLGSSIALAANFGPASLNNSITVSTTWVNVVSLGFSASFTTADPCQPFLSCPTANTASLEGKLNYPGDDLLNVRFLLDNTSVPANITEDSNGVYWARATHSVTKGNHIVRIQCVRKSSTTSDVTVAPGASTTLELRASAG